MVRSTAEECGFADACIVAPAQRDSDGRKFTPTGTNERIHQLTCEVGVAAKQFQQRVPVDRRVQLLRSALRSANLGHGLVPLLGADRNYPSHRCQ